MECRTHEREGMADAYRAGPKWQHEGPNGGRYLEKQGLWRVVVGREQDSSIRLERDDVLLWVQAVTCRHAPKAGVDVSDHEHRPAVAVPACEKAGPTSPG